MTTQALLDAPLSRETSAETLDRTILEHLEEQAVIGLDALIVLMPAYSWSQIFHAVDRLARCLGAPRLLKNWKKLINLPLKP